MKTPAATTAPQAEERAVLVAGPHEELQQRRLRQAKSVFYSCLGYTAVATTLWVFLMATGTDEGLFFGDYRPTVRKIIQATASLTFFWMVWSYAFHWLK